MSEDIISCSPQFVEIYKFPQNQREYAEFLKDFQAPPIRAVCSTVKQGEWNKLLAEVRRVDPKITNRPNPRNQDYFVLGMKIQGDTRLDEACYHLTRKELKGGLREKRDELLRYLFFRAGVLNGLLATYGFAWSSDLVYSNSHFGNFTLSSRKGMLDVRICDLGSARFISGFEKQHEFIKFTNQEVDNFKHEFERTSGMTVQTRYKHFPRKLKRECFDALRTGYAIMLSNYQKSMGDILMSYDSPRIIVPDKAVISVDEFKDLIRGLNLN
jgi:hypothetical protein